MQTVFIKLSWEENKIRYLFLIVSIPLLIFVGLAAVIGWYIILCWFVRKRL